MRVRLASLVMGGLAAATLGLSFAAPNAFASAQHPAAHAARGFSVVASSPDTPLTADGLIAASHPAIHPDFSGVSLVIKSKTSECEVSNGQGAQMSVSTSGCANLTSSTVNFEGNTLMQIKNGNGNCERGKTDDTVEIGNGACSNTDGGAMWFSETGSPSTGPGPYTNFSNGTDMATKCNTNNCNVFTDDASGTFKIVEG